MSGKQQNIPYYAVFNMLSFAIAVACEMRLRVYSSYQFQCDNAVDLKHNQSKSIEKFLDIVGAASTVNYFQIAYCLQYEVAKQLKFTKLHFYSDQQLINFTIGLAFGIKEFKINFSKNTLKVVWDLNNFDFDKCIEKLESANNVYYVTSANSMAIDFSILRALATHLYTTKVYDESLKFFQQALVYHQSESSDVWVCRFYGVTRLWFDGSI